MTPPRAIDTVLVVIPAHNEIDRISRCLTSVVAAAAAARRCDAVDTWIVVAADGCADGTAELAELIISAADGSPIGEVVQGDWRSVGSARRAGVSAGLSTLLDQHDRLIAADVWIANTDADCEVPTDWIVGQLDHHRRGADAVLGIVAVDNFDDHPAGVEDRFIQRYELADDGSHHHVHGANLGVRADRYLAAGGWPAVAVSEDHALAGALASVGAATVSTIDVTVVTSGRRVGRARGGFADLLADLANLGESA